MRVHTNITHFLIIKGIKVPQKPHNVHLLDRLLQTDFIQERAHKNG